MVIAKNTLVVYMENWSGRLLREHIQCLRIQCLLWYRNMVYIFVPRANILKGDNVKVLNDMY